MPSMQSNDGVAKRQLTPPFADHSLLKVEKFAIEGDSALHVGGD